MILSKFLKNRIIIKYFNQWLYLFLKTIINYKFIKKIMKEHLKFKKKGIQIYDLNTDDSL
jgi:3-hydroxyacyl-CoA dehydrogenase